MATIIDTSDKNIGLKREMGRKAIHLGALVMPAGLWLLPPTTVRPLLLFAFLISVVLDVSRWFGGPPARFLQATVGQVLRPHESQRFSGATYILAAGALCATLYDRPVAVAVLIFIILGDTAAVFVGRYLGHIHFGQKTLEGSLGFFAAALLGVLWIPQVPLYVKVIGAATAAFVEALPQPLDDNLAVPLVAGMVMTALLS